MSRKVFLSFLGTGNYTPVKYATNENHKGLVLTRFVQEAFIKQHCLDYAESDRIYIALTQGAESKNWNDGHYLDENELQSGLHKVLQGYNLGNRLEPILGLPNGKKEEEMWEIFDRIYEKLNFGDEVIFDITHAFRSLPFLAMALFNFAKFTKKVELKSILYGAFDSLNKDGTAQVWDLLPYMILQEYAVGAAMFTRYGKGDFLSDVIKERNSKIDYSQLEYKPLKEVKRVAESFSEFSNLLSINHIPGAFKVAKNFPLKVQRLKNTNNIPLSVKPFLKILDDLARYIEPIGKTNGILFGTQGISAQLDLMDICIQSKNYAQAISICRELLVSYISILLGNEDILNYSGTRKEVEVKLNKIAGLNRQGDEVLSPQQVEIAKLWDKITEIRNVINHAFMDKGKKGWSFDLSSSKAKEACELLKKVLNENIIRKADFENI